jgi:bifunctional DNA-binding transcriptional regulator/antitoxin component of YhaV-PrlF toxin-antitoxin module
MLLVKMNDEGRITVPVEARRELGLTRSAPWLAEVRDGELVLRPADLIPRPRTPAA